MNIGEKIRCARLEAGLSQRALCGEQITRNMLSLIENGSANPSMDTLTYFARQLNKPVSYFLDENTVVSPNQGLIETARAAFAAGDYAAALQITGQYQSPDPVFDSELGLLEGLSRLFLAEQALSQGRKPYAESLLAQRPDTPYFTPTLERQWLLLLGKLPPADDRELLLRAEDALSKDLPRRSLEYLHAAQDHDTSDWYFLCGKAYLALQDYENAAASFEKAQDAAPQHRLTSLETCYRELGDFEKAYRCACQLRELEVRL